MSSYVICEMNSGCVNGTFPDLSSAQAESQAQADAYASGNPDLSVQNTETYYACVRTRVTSRSYLGISLLTSQQVVDNSWTISQLGVPPS